MFLFAYPFAAFELLTDLEEKMSATTLQPVNVSYAALPSHPEFDALERQACLCKTATKAAGCVCLPLSWICLICNEVSEGKDPTYDYNPDTGVRYASFTACDCGEGWASRLPPKDKCDLFLQIFDPLVCCLPCAKETSVHYLPPHKQQRWKALAPQAQGMAYTEPRVERHQGRREPAPLVNFRDLGRGGPH